MDRFPTSRSDLFRSRRTRTAAVALGVVAALTLTACGGGGSTPKAATGPDAQRTQDGATLQAYWPLTGLPVKGKAPGHPPMVVKIDNTYSSQPQVGLTKADLISEELVEGGLTRLAVFFDTHIPGLVGPVRSMRASDIGLVKPVKGIVVTSGAAPPTIARLKGAGVRFASNDGGAPGFYRDSNRVAPYNLMMKLPELEKTLKKPTEVTPAYLPWGKESDFTGVSRATSIQARFGQGHTTVWAYRGGHYVNTNTNAAAGKDFRPDTVVVVRVGVRNAGYLDPAGNFVPESITTGHGNAFVFHRGKVERATWSKAGASKTWKLRTTAGSLKIPPGHTWLEVLPSNKNGGSLTFGK